MDWIVGLPRTVERYDAILTVTDRLTKMVHFIPTRVESDAVETAHLFLREVVRLHGLPREIVSDRDPRFTGEMWREMCRCLGIRQALSTAYHPRTDGQSERTNQTLEQVLRSYVLTTQRDWYSGLSSTEMAVNGSVAKATGVSPFFANYGFDPVLLCEVPEVAFYSRSEAAEEFVSRMQLIEARVAAACESAAGRQRVVQDEGRLAWLLATLCCSRRKTSR